MSYYPNQSPLVCIFNNTSHAESSLTSFAEFTTSLFEGFVDSSDNTVIQSTFPLSISGDVRYTFSGGGGLRSVSYFEVDSTNTAWKGRSENAGGSGARGVSPEIFFVKTNSIQKIKLELNKKSSAGVTYSTDYSRVIGLL